MAVCISQQLQEWVVARKRFHLTDAHVQMARELGMNPRKLGKLDNHIQEPWKIPLPQFIEHCYLKRFGRERPEPVRSIEEIAHLQEAKKSARRARKADRRAASAVSASTGTPVRESGSSAAAASDMDGAELSSPIPLRWPHAPTPVSDAEG